MELCLCRTVFAGFHHDWPGFYEASPQVAPFCCFPSGLSLVLPAVCLLLCEKRARCRSGGRWDSALAQRKIQGKWHFSSEEKSSRCRAPKLLSAPPAREVTRDSRRKCRRQTRDVAFATVRIGETSLYCIRFNPVCA